MVKEFVQINYTNSTVDCSVSKEEVDFINLIIHKINNLVECQHFINGRTKAFRLTALEDKLMTKVVNWNINKICLDKGISYMHIPFDDIDGVEAKVVIRKI